MALPRSVRLKNRRLFKQALNVGQTLLSCPYYKVIALKRAQGQAVDECQPTQWGCIVSKKVSKLSPVRNRIKRQLRHLFRPYLIDSPALNEYRAIVCIARFAMANEVHPPNHQQLAFPLQKASMGTKERL